MKTKITQNNPLYREPNFAFGYEYLRDGMRVLDYGCFDGRFGKKVMPHKSINYFGVDKNADILSEQDPDLQISLVTFPLSFPDDYFDAIVVFEVLEHIADQERILKELQRVLKTDGIIIISTPRKHVFSILDMANWKFMFPRLHRMYYRVSHSKDEYLRRYKDSPHGLVGDIEEEKRWHQHFRDEEMMALLERSGFDVMEMDASGLFRLPMTDIGHIFKLTWLFPNKLRDWDSYQFSSTQLICSARKRQAK